MKTNSLTLKRMLHRGLSFLAARIPALADRFVDAFDPLEFKETPWTPFRGPMQERKIAVVTTAGIHHRGQAPFDMHDADGDPTFRVLDAGTIEKDYAVTHDYYDHGDVRRDLNVVFPLARLREMQKAGCIGEVAGRHISFMGHIDGPHVWTLIGKTAPSAAALLARDGVDAVLLTPA